MTNEKLSNSKVCVEQVASTQAQTLKLGLDVHADSIVVVRIVDHSAPQPAQKFTPAKFREWVKGQRRLAQAVHSCYEAGPFGYGHQHEDKLNVNGGAQALGHPLGGTGAKLMTTLVHELHARGARYGLQTMCEGGGLANVTIVERV
mgnify:CR=1 FL=1